MLKLIKDQMSISSTMRNCYRCYVANTNKESPEGAKKEEDPATKKAKKSGNKIPSIKTVERIRHHLVSIGSRDLIPLMPDKLWKMTNSPRSLYLIDKIVAKRIKTVIEDDIVKNPDSFWAEINPGFGLLTELLLETSVSKIHLFEPHVSFSAPDSQLMKLLKKNCNRLELREKNLLQLWTIVFRDFHKGTQNLNELLKGTEKKKWTDEPYMKVIGTCTNANFIKQLTMSVIFQNTFMAKGRVAFYLIMSPSSFEKFIAQPNSSFYNDRSIMFQLLFNWEKLDTFPRKSFLPWINDTLIKKHHIRAAQRLIDLNKNSLYFVKIEPKADLFQEDFKQKDLFSFFYFIKYHLQVHNTRIIPALEKWIPGCGPRLIMMDYNIYTECKELSPQQLLKVYKEFSSWPEFKSSYFVTSASTYISSIEEAVSESRLDF